MIDILITVLAFSGVAFTLLGMLVVFHLGNIKTFPMDESNRINHIRLVWFALTRPEIFTDYFAWLKNDELDNLKDKND